MNWRKVWRAVMVVVDGPATVRNRENMARLEAAAERRKAGNADYREEFRP